MLLSLTNMEELREIGPLPELREPILLAGFAGWNDAGQAATHALHTLVRSWSAKHVMEIEPETFFDFTETRPMISIGLSGQRELEWPKNSFYVHSMPQAERDVVLLIGTEPNLRWKAFCRMVLEVADRLQVSCLVTLGALLADVPHTMEPRLSGFATTPRLLPQLQRLGVRMSSYEGPTGILGALHDAWLVGDRPALSLWGNVPHYISAAPNPRVSLALLQRVAALLGNKLPLSSLVTQATAFDAQIDEALAENPEALEYVHQLERQYQGETPAPPDAPELIEELEQFLRGKRPPDDPRLES